MDLGLKNKVIVVTGGSKGIGGGIVCLLANEGAIPVILGRNKESIFKAIIDYKQNGYEVGYAIAELTNPNQCEAAIDSIIKNYGRIDGLVNNAGVNDGVGLENALTKNLLIQSNGIWHIIIKLHNWFFHN